MQNMLEDSDSSNDLNTKYVCTICDYKCSWKSDYNKHVQSVKHKRLIEALQKQSQNTEKLYKCVCGKEYKQSPSLTRHRRKCQQANTSQNEKTTEHIQKFLIEQQQQYQHVMNVQQEENKELKKMLIEQQDKMLQQQEQHNKQLNELIPKLQQVTTINNTTNNTTNNTKFNLNFFLNEQCKDAISIQTFMRELNIGIKELEHMGNVGYLQGMISIMSNTLCSMDIYKRPVHCTDLKRETIYIKDGDTWKKDNANNDDLKRVIDDVADVNYRNLQLWETQHPEAFECDTPDNIEYCKIALESLGGGNNNEEQAASKLKKIVKHVVREVYVK